MCMWWDNVTTSFRMKTSEINTTWIGLYELWLNGEHSNVNRFNYNCDSCLCSFQKMSSAEHPSLDPHRRPLHLPVYTKSSWPFVITVHHSATGGHQGWHKTLHKLHIGSTWINMAQDADQRMHHLSMDQTYSTQTSTLGQHSSQQAMADGSSGYIGSICLHKQQ